MCFVPKDRFESAGVVQFLKETSVEVNGQTLKVLIDTGSTQTLVQRRYVSPLAICTTETLPICCVRGDERQYPTVDVYIKMQGQTC